ncbi:MAG: hypothetical protein ABI645_00850 [Pseudomonadota bacterium]
MSLSCVLGDVSGAQPEARLELEGKIPLGDVKGRIDHLTLDLQRQRLFVAELGNNTVGVLDLESRKLLQRLSGFDEPQGVAWSSRVDRLYVASGGDGMLRTFAGESLAKGQAIALGSDADNVRLDQLQENVYVGVGSGAIAMLDARTLQQRGNVAFSGHPESYQLESQGMRAFVNVPDARQVIVLDRASRKVLARWPLDFAANFPLALDEAGSRIFVVFRSPATLGVYSTLDGSTLGRVKTCGDADDVFLDASRGLVYVICGEGRVDIFETRGAALDKVGSMVTAPGARTGYFSPDLDRLYVAVRASGAEPAAIWVLRASNDIADVKEGGDENAKTSAAVRHPDHHD